MSAAPALTFGFRVLLPLFRFLPPPPLTLGRLPAAQLAEALRFLAVALIPGPWQKLAATALPVTSPRREPTPARRTPGRGAMLFSSHGRWCSRWGRPRDWLSPSGTFVLTNLPPAVVLVSGIPGRWAQNLSLPATPRLGLPQDDDHHLRSPAPGSAPRDPVGQTIASAAHRRRRKTTKKTGKETVLS